MKKFGKIAVSLTLCLMMLLGSVAIGGSCIADLLETISVKASATTITSYSTGDTFKFGWYPQTKETDEGIIASLNASSGTWVSYNYYSGTGDWDDGQMTSSNYMRYKDVMYGTTKYRGVVFDSYRPYCTGYTSSNNQQSTNGYSTGTTYWFKYEPIKWKVLDPSTGLVLTDAILDSQAYNNYILYSGSYYYGDADCTYYANNYAESSIRQWLNNDFYNTAFSTAQQNIIQSTVLDNSAYSTSYSAYDSVSTTDKIYLLSYSDALNSSYGFSTSTSSSSTRTSQGTDYAKCQGLYVYKSSGSAYDGNSWWRLRSAGDGSDDTCGVDHDGDVDYYYFTGTYYTNFGVRAALNLNLKSDIFQSDVSETGKGNGSGCGEAVTTVKYAEYSQMHTVSDYASDNEALKTMYLSCAGEPLDGSNGNPDICVPGLTKSDNMIPQGMTYWEEKDCILISAYDENDSDASVIYGINASNGNYVAEYILNDEDGKELATHVGGIAVSDNNLYITIGQKIGYISLDTLKNSYGESKTVKIEGRKSVADKIKDAKLSYITYSDGYLYCGNFYHPDEDAYDDPASDDYNSIILRYKLTEDETEWATFDESEPVQTLNVPNSIDKIQSAIYADGKLIIRSSYGRGNDSSLYINDIDLSVNAALKAGEFVCYHDLPMAEGMFEKDGYLYFLYESGAYKYNGGELTKCSYPTDVVWKVNIDALTFSDYTRERTLYGKNYADDNDNISSKYLNKAGTALDGDGNIDTLIPGLADGMVPQAMTYMNYGGKEWILVGAYDSNEVNPCVIYAIDFNTGEYVAQFNVYNKDGTNNMGHMGGIAASSQNLYISDGIPGETSTIGYVPLSDLVVDKYTNNKIYIEDNVDIGSSMNDTYPAYLSYSDGELWTGNFYNSAYFKANYTTPASSINDTLLIGYSLSGDSTEWSTFKSNAQKNSYSHKVFVPDYDLTTLEGVHSIQGCYIADDYCYLSMGTTAIGSTLYVFDIDLDRGRNIELSTEPHNKYTNLNGAENIFIKDGYLYCIYESAASGVPVYFTGGDETDVIWKMKLDKDTIISNRVFYDDVSYTTFKKSIEDYVLSTSSSTYSPELASMLMTFSSSAYDKTNLLSSLKNCGFKTGAIELSDNYDKELEDEVGFAIASKTLSDGTKLVFIPIRGSDGALEWASDFNVGTTSQSLHKGFAKAMEAVYAELEDYFFGSIPTSNVKYVMTGHSRGAAVSNLLAWKLTQCGVSQSDIYSYNFACPDTVYETYSMDNPESYSCIFNINNANDLVSYVPGIFCSVTGSWKKFGKSYWFKENGDSTKPDIGFGAHNNVKYTTYLGNKKALSSYMTLSQVKEWMEEDDDVWSSIKSFLFVGVYCPVSVEVVDINGNVVASVIDGELQGTVKEGCRVFFRTNGEQKELIFPKEDNYTVRITGNDEGTMACGIATLNLFESSLGDSTTYTDVVVTEGKVFETKLSDDAYAGRLFVKDSAGTVVSEVTTDGEEIPYTTENEFVKTEINGSVDYKTSVAVKIHVEGIPSGYYMALYKNGEYYNRTELTSETGQYNVTCYLGNLTEDTDLTVKFVDKNGNYYKDINGNVVEQHVGKISCNSSFFKKLIAFFKELFGSLPHKEFY